MKPKLLLLTILLSYLLYSQETPPNMALIPAGEFTMGKNTPNPTDWQLEHKEYVDAFYMDKYEVTNKQYDEY